MTEENVMTSGIKFGKRWEWQEWVRRSIIRLVAQVARDKQTKKVVFASPTGCVLAEFSFIEPKAFKYEPPECHDESADYERSYHIITKDEELL